MITDNGFSNGEKLTKEFAKADFTLETNVGQLVLANSNWCVCTTQQHVGEK